YRIASTDPGIDPPSAFFNTARNAADRKEFDKLLAQPRFRWFGAWIPTHDAGGKRGARATAENYIAQVTGGDPAVAVGIGIFRLQPFEHEACNRLPTAAEIADYKSWIGEFAAGIGNARVALLLQPDMPFTLCLPHHSPVDLQLIDWTVRRFSALAHTTVYIDAGAADWQTPAAMASMLKRAGVARARGFALNLTHYDSTGRQVVYGKKIVKELARRGVPNSHFVVNTAQNGRPFTTQAHNREFKLAFVCRTRSSRACVTLGRPPTTNTGIAQVDGYLWLGRPWINNATRRNYDEVLQLVKTSPYFG
ncbi:MAG: endoglucanase, partial [Thermoleophilaceae bacterium]|nr:endoglucanase [Thermoleophilaceae bacterium]